MNFSSLRRRLFVIFALEWRLLAPVYIVLSFLELRLRILLSPGWMGGQLAHNHASLLAFTYTNNEQSRLLQFVIPEIFHHIFSLAIVNAYMLQRFFFVFLAFSLFHQYLRRWFSVGEAFAGVAFLAAIMPLSFINDLQESAPLMLVTFLLGLWAIRENSDAWFLLTLFVGALNNETMLILTAAYFFVHFFDREQRTVSVFWRTFLVSYPAWIAVAMIRFLTWKNPHLGNPLQLPNNLSFIAYDFSHFLRAPFHLYEYSYFYILWLFGIFWIYAIAAWSSTDPFLRKVSLIIPFFIAAHMITGVISEVRQMVPLAFIIIPMGMLYILERTKGAHRM